MNNLKKRVLFSIITVVLLNTITLTCWFYFKISPAMNHVQELENTIVTQELRSNYPSLDSLLTDIKRISEQYHLKISLEDVHGQKLTDFKKGSQELFLFSDIVLVEDQMYALSFYSSKNISAISIITQLIIFQIIVVSFCMMVIFLITRAKIVKPVEQIILNIQNYQAGRRPVRHKLDHEFNLIQTEFFNLVDSLDTEKQEQNRIIASISHDIKTPLTSIIGYATLIDDSNLTKEEMKQYNRKIKEKSLTIKNMLNDFDDYLSNQTNQQLKLTTITIHDLVQDLKNDYKVDLESKHIDFKIYTKLDQELITIDLLKMKRVFANIISNSIRYLKEGGMITINITKDEQNYLFKVADNGPGVPEELLDKIFDLLFTTDKSRKISGLGLSIVKEFILMHRGQVKAYNENGLVIEFTIPVD